MELGLYTFADVSPEPGPGAIDPHERLRNLIEEVELADQVGLDVFGLGEHHRPDYAASAPVVALAAAAERTKRIKLTSAVTVLSSDDPVRVFQQFATLDLLSGGRAEIMAGRGSFIESFPLFGYNLEDYDELFAEKLDLLLAIREQVKVTWQGKLRAPINGRGVYPRPFRDKLPIWIAIGGTPQSAARAGALGLPLALAIIGGEPARFAPLFEIYREAARRAGNDPASLATSLNVHGFVGETTEKAADDFYATQAEVMNRIGRERGWGPTSRAHFDQARGPNGALFVGDPEQVAQKIVAQHEIFGNDRFLLQMAIGTMPHAKVMKAIELYGTKVAPVVRKETAKAAPAPVA
ncbi:MULTISPECIES: LLM class flavin-dependent oxidoreductase [unclassified Mesorhizobium]|uniref:LLM class flavin-dependent oxidoreductase n=2 Tax=Mesorhizobium TaxID=68287 RepID=UPI000FCCA264|nr:MULTISPECIES: LLM class flavin-dependent oxidoreductase [unclassified Mesorhizobium]RUV42574.1 LLM class flavin-dependent oxidoreductase [Mesorhizobium sp. M1A.T.Ca.IN.004.03.1.1]RWI95414.1 MAG: LLM class flavin-dependent oxidoreductase [Mesorhizobium sp.]RWK37167.1 MAG: LLM class flavin-dependent oxidoreductase [Mesorhizobium sp.]RWK86314.1 MAG: LLM class flavin-dependent oxidoreductase [Mesorhizobium sp.]TIP19423.1 MAG: LLM class flavin-dependent oxidoreductase [Mesorhizobium sp.]